MLCIVPIIQNNSTCETEYEKYKSYLEPIFPELNFSYAVNGTEASDLLTKAEVIISIGRWLTPEKHRLPGQTLPAHQMR